jgi:hypothetical protein
MTRITNWFSQQINVQPDRTLGARSARHSAHLAQAAHLAHAAHPALAALGDGDLPCSLASSRLLVSRRPSGTAIAEFGPALFIFLILFMIPCVNLVLYASAVATINHVAEEASRAAAVSSTQTEAIQFVASKADRLLHGDGQGPGLAAYANLTPQGGVLGTTGKPTGCKLEVLVRANTDTSGVAKAIDISNGFVQLGSDSPSFGANSANDHYEYRVTGTYVVNPFLNMAGIPLIGQVPAVGAPTTVSYASTAQIENVKGLDN